MALAWLGTFGAAAYGLHQLEPYAERVSTADVLIEWVAPPQWLNDENWSHLLPELEKRIDLDPRTDTYDDRVCAWVAERLAESAWIERVQRVTKQQDGRVRIQADFRKPFAMVERDGIAYLVDDRGMRLPTPEWPASRVNRAGWFVLRGVKSPPKIPGQRWPGEDLEAGLKLAAFLHHAEAVGRLPFRDEITAIDVSNFRGQNDPGPADCN